MKYFIIGLLTAQFCGQEPYLLEENLIVYADGKTATIHPQKGFKQYTLPTINHYLGTDGGYVAIYTKNPAAGIYSVGNDIYVAGQVRVQGTYQGRIFVPKGYTLDDDITKEPLFFHLENYFPHLRGQMWVGGDTGSWFGLN